MQLWPWIFALTCLLELPVYLWLLRPAVTPARGLLVCIGLNLLTHPLVWFVFPTLLENQVHYVLVAEAFAVIVEGLALVALARWRGWEGFPWLSLVGVAFLANAFSATVGELVGYRLLDLLGLVPG
jgi:hypothetical protein